MLNSSQGNESWNPVFSDWKFKTMFRLQPSSLLFYADNFRLWEISCVNQKGKVWSCGFIAFSIAAPAAGGIKSFQNSPFSIALQVDFRKTVIVILFR